MNEKFKYEVAFSFLTQDEALAQRLNDLLQDRMSTFIYTERQLELAGKDGEIILKKAFGSESRIVVTLYRKEWGTTPWTRIEQDAIRERAFNQGYDFCILIPLDEPPAKPQWFPSHRFWVGLQRWGVEAAAAVIEARVQEAGGTAREESLADRKARLERKILAAERRKTFLDSEEAVKPANEESQKLFETICDLASSLSTNEFPLQVKSDHSGTTIASHGFVLQLEWHRAYSNSLSGSGLYLCLLEVDRNKPFDRSFHQVEKFDFDFAIDESDRYGWRATWGEEPFYTSKELAEFALRLLLEKVAEFRERIASQNT